MQSILPVLHRDQAVAHKQILVTLTVDGLLELITVHLPGRRIGVLSGPRVFAAVRDIFCSFIEKRKVLFSELFIDFKEPVRVKAPVIQFLRRERRVSGNHSLLAVVEPLIHVGHEIITAALEALHSEDFLRHVEPLGRVHGNFDEAFF